MLKVRNMIKRLSTAKILCFGFALVILVGAFILWLPISLHEGKHIQFLDALFVSGSAVCVTGLTTVDVGNTFSAFGETVIAILIQIGGLGIATIGVLFIMIVGKNIGLKSRLCVRDSMNISGLGGLIKSVQTFLKIALVCEAIGAILSFFVFLQDYPISRAIGISIFHSISAFNNAGFDILGGFDSLLQYKNDVFLNLVTAGLVILGGLGFLVMMDIIKTHSWKRFMLQTKIVITMTVFLLFMGTVLIKMNEDITWLGAFFTSTIARTAGFSTYPLADFTMPSIFVFLILMYIGASPGSTGGGVKTTTIFAVFVKAISSSITRTKNMIFRRRLSDSLISRAGVVLLFASTVIFIGTFLLLCFEPNVELHEALVEVTSAFATVGSSCGITTSLSEASKILIIVVMFIGRLGPVTIASLLMMKEEPKIMYTEENIMIG